MSVQENPQGLQQTRPIRGNEFLLQMIFKWGYVALSCLLFHLNQRDSFFVLAEKVNVTLCGRIIEAPFKLEHGSLVLSMKTQNDHE